MKTKESTVYEPREDSFLLEKAVSECAFGSFLDVGTGSGIQAIAAARNPKVTKVTAIDVNLKALASAKENARNAGVESKITFIESDLFSALKEMKFDTIAFNPPYLPSSEEYSSDIALESGKSGREATERFLEKFQEHLNPRGIVLLLQSSASDWEKTKENLESKGHAVSIEGKQSFFFEELVVLKATKTAGTKK